MCGIAGIVSYDASSYTHQLTKMMDSLKHRGPDGIGSVFFNSCALGHRRLKIVDLNTGDQPMFSKSKKTAIVFNGEIYGYKEIRKTVKEYSFITLSDTEVILALYEKFGNKFLKLLPGMFSFAIWNNEKRELFCARDRFGEKPFYYAWGKNQEFIFASEIKGIIASGLIDPVLSPIALKHYIEHLYVHPYHTIYENIFTLPPAHSLLLNNNKTSVQRYWNLPATIEKIDLNEAEEKFRYLLQCAVDKMLIADVPIGAFLSGGIDSSSVVAFAGNINKGIHTFSFGFEEGVNELPFAKVVAEKLQTQHTELEDKHEDIAELILRMTDVYDEPFADSSNIPTYLISKYAAKYQKVVLTGDGGDEMLGGYVNWYKPLLNNDSKILQKSFLKLAAKKILGKTQNNLVPYNNNFSALAKRHLSQNIFFNEYELNALGLQNVMSFNTPSVYHSNTVDDAMRMDIENYMPGDILVKTDRASMANGLELRAPFLDVDLASFCISLPYIMKISNESDKIILKNALRERLPATILSRKKQGFGAPINPWLKLKPVAELKRNFLCDNNKKIFSIFPFRIIQNIIQADDYKTWQLLILSLWMEKHSFSIN